MIKNNLITPKYISVKFLINLLIGFSLMLVSYMSSAQSCSATNIILSSQSDVDDFQATYGPCDSIIGTLFITDANSNLVDLSGLSTIETSGGINVNGNNVLVDFSGLENLEIRNLGSIVIANNPLLNDVSQLSNIGPALANLTLDNNPVLTDLSIIQNVNTLGRLRVTDMDGLTDMDGFSSITAISTEYNIRENDLLNDLSGLSGFVFGNSGSNKTFRLENNPNLSDCSPICPIVKIRLPEISNITTTIQNNLGDCIDEASVISNCGRTPCNQNNIVLTSNGEVQSFQATYGPCDSIVGNLDIDGGGTINPIVDLLPLSALEYVGNNLHVSNNIELTGLEGLEGVIQPDLNLLEVNSNPQLTDISQLSGIGPDVDILFLTTNNNLADLTGIQNIQNVARLDLIANSNLVNLDGLSNIQDITTSIRIRNNAKLNNIDGLSGITYGSGNNLVFTLMDNPLLFDCSPLCSIVNDFSTLTFNTKEIDDNLGSCIDEAALVGACCSHPDFVALEAIYNSTGGDLWTNNTGWLEDCDPCGIVSGTPWNGITCGGGTNRVTQLDLNLKNLSGELPSEIGQLTELVDLKIVNNPALMGELPEELGDLLSLTNLEITTTAISGQIPESFCNLTSLLTLNLAFNDLVGALPTCLTSLTNLTIFSVTDNQLSGPLPEFGAAHPNLVGLFLSVNNFSGTLPTAWSGLSGLLVLQVFDNDLSGHWPQSFSSLCGQISTADFNNNTYDGINDFISDQGWSDFCAGIVGSTPCGDAYVVIPDSNFEQALISLAIDSEGSLDGCVLKADIESVQDLDISKNQISNLTGIEAFKALENLLVHENSLPATTNLSTNVNLKYVKASY